MNQNALLLAFRDAIKLNIFLDYKDNDMIYIQFGSEYKMARADFQGLINFLRVAKQAITPEKLKGQPGVISPKSMKVGFVWLQENSYLKVEYSNFIKVMSQEAFYTFLEELEMAVQSMDRYDKVKEMTPELRAAAGIDEAGRALVIKDTLYTIRLFGYGLAVLLMIIDMILLVAGIFNPMLLFPVAIIFLVIILAYLLLPVSEKKALAMFVFNIKHFMNEDFWKMADGLPISRKTIEFFIILLIVMTLMTAYFSKAIPTILSWGKSLYGDSKPESSGTDVLSSLSFSSKGGTAYYDSERKFTGMAELYKTFFEHVSSSKLTLKRLTATAAVGGNHGGMYYCMDGEFLNTGGFSNAQDFTQKMQKYKPASDVRVENSVNVYSFKIIAEFGFSSVNYFKKVAPSKRNKKGTEEMLRRHIYTAFGPGTPCTLTLYSAGPLRDRMVYEHSFTLKLKSYDDIVRLLSLVESEKICHEVIVEEISRDTSGLYEMKIKLIMIGTK